MHFSCVIKAHPRNHCCHGNARVSLYFVELHAAVNNIKLVVGFAAEMEQLISFALLPSYQIFRSVVSNTIVPTFSRKVTYIFVPL